ncbi:potassium transporter Kup [Undibacterium cyanobacteriorum]|uniref:Probable potassium transport system protein Kup n=1 Tax=Undibacterium cyanobacteriorum TaxID=3073561 RepID=A0ABY9RMR8_9BURK|nr:potassium transporter Kup [Undibacterium sp. 20NA77.5]WMW82261.1 potassium transporter Kup [Undibacterium sp. 20NA77.5]
MAHEHSKSSLSALTLAAIGIVYGDIGTSPLYTMQEVFDAKHGLVLNQGNILGIVSLILWGLIFIVSLKYVTLVLRASNRGEGGIMALTALTLESVGKSNRLYFPLVILGIIGASLFYGDGVVTPAMTVLSAIEGIKVATPALKPFVVPITLIILVCLYAVQSHGTATIGKLFGPVMVLWFAVLAAMGMYNILRMPAVLEAFNPLYAIGFLTEHRFAAFIALGAVVLAFTGSEALYADMGHFGPKPIRTAWFMIVFPALGLNYLGQGALLMVEPEAVENPFFNQLGDWSIYPLVVLSTMAAVIASQATISGAFSMTKQAISLGFLPRMKIVHTSSKEIGQIYIPVVNWLQLAAVVGAVLGFGSAGNLASAYGIANTGTMLVTSILTFFVIRYGWKYNLALCIASTSFFLFIDVSLFSSNAMKFFSGGWFPIALGIGICTVMLTWKRGRSLVFDNLKKHAIPLEEFLESLFVSPPVRVAGTAVFLRGEADGVPHALLHNLSHNKVLHERVIFITLHNREIPWVPFSERIKVTDLKNNCFQIDVFYGFKNEPDIPNALELCRPFGLEFEPLETSYFISRQTIISSPGSGMATWREGLFVTMSRNARDAADYYQIPSNRVIEVGAQVEI